MTKKDIDIMTRISEKLDKVFRYIVLILFGIFVMYLTLLSLFSTNYCFVGKPSIFVSDSPVLPLLGYVLLIGVLILARKIGVSKWFKIYYEKLRRIGNFLLLLFLLFFVASTQLHPHGDQLAISNAAVGLRKYDFSLFIDKSYFVYWPFQSRIVVFLWGFFKLFGNLNYMAFQIMNALCIVITLNLIARTAAITGFGGNKEKETLIFFACCLFWPYLFYVTFIYGNIVGFAFIAAAVYMLIRYVKEQKVRYLIGTVFFCATGVWLKNTYLIFMVAIIVFLFVDFWQRWRYSSVIGLFCVMVAVLLFASISDALIERRLGFPLSEGSPMIAWVTMAFGEDENGTPVKFDGYNRDVYFENDMDTEKAQIAAVEELKCRLALLTDTPEHFFRFMGKKLAMEWNEPTFESLVANNRPETQIEQSDLIRRLLQEDSRNPLIWYANLFQSLVLLGTLSWLFCKGKKENLFHFFFAVVFIGGFLFQLFWETYSQYTLFYFLLLIPYALSGYLAISEKVENCIVRKTVDFKLTLGIVSVLLLIAVVSVVPIRIFRDIFKLNENNVSYAQELSEADATKRLNESVIESGEYRLIPVFMEDCVIMLENMGEEGDNGFLLSSPEKDTDGVFLLYSEYGYDFLRFKATQLLLSLSGSPSEGEVTVGQDYDYAAWKIIEIPEKGYAITYDKDYALTVSDGALTVQPFTGSEDQLWQFEKR